MSELSRIKASTANELVQHFDLSDEGDSIAVLDEAPVKVITQLLSKENYHDAVTMPPTPCLSEKRCGGPV